MEIQHQDDKRESKRHSLPNVYAGNLLSADHKTQRCVPGWACWRKQCKPAQPRQERLVRRAIGANLAAPHRHRNLAVAQSVPHWPCQPAGLQA